MTGLEELQNYAEDAKAQIDRVVAAARSLIEEGADSKTRRATEEIIYPSAEMLEGRC